MAEDQDDSQKTEEPTQKKLDEARKKGQVAVSREIGHWGAMLAGFLALGVAGPWAGTRFVETATPFIANAHRLAFDGASVGGALIDAALGAILMLAPLLLLAVLLAIGFGVAQTGMIFSAEQMRPKLSKLSPIEGAKRIFGMRAMVEFAKGIAKLCVVAGVALVILVPAFEGLDQWIGAEMATILDQLRYLLLLLIAGVMAVMTVVAGADFLYTRLEHRKKLRMSRQDLKDEFKQTEGDPLVKARLRQLRMEKAQRRMMAEVPKASVVIANPTHYAVALRYEPPQDVAPVVLAKGVDAVALRIREVAEEHDIPIVENPPLARSLHAVAELDREIPEDQYKAVAEVIAYILSLKQNAKPARR